MAILIEDSHPVRGEVHAYVFDGEVSTDFLSAIDDRNRPEWSRLACEFHDRNLVTNVGRQQMTRVIVGETTLIPTNIGLSTAVITAALADTALPSEINRSVITVTQSINTYYQRYVALFTTASFSAPSGVFGEGLFDAATTGGNMWAEASISVVSKSTTQALVVDHRIQATT